MRSNQVNRAHWIQLILQHLRWGFRRPQRRRIRKGHWEEKLFLFTYPTVNLIISSFLFIPPSKICFSQPRKEFAFTPRFAYCPKKCVSLKNIRVLVRGWFELFFILNVVLQSAVILRTLSVSYKTMDVAYHTTQRLTFSLKNLLY